MKTFKLIAGAFYVVSSHLASFKFEKCEASSNVVLIGYSEALKQLIVEFKGDKRYIYTEVPQIIWDQWQAEKDPEAPKFGVFLAANVKGVFPYKEVTSETQIQSAKGEDVISQLETLGHYYDSTGGLWAIDQDPAIVDLDWIRRNAHQLQADKK